MAIDLYHIRKLFTFYHWAEDQVLDAFAPVTATRLDAPWGGSFATGRGLLEHVIGSDRVWIARWHGTSLMSRPPVPTTYAGVDFRREWEEIKRDHVAYLDTLTPARLDEPFSYVKFSGEHCTFPLADVLIHVLNHGTYHRGQLAHLLRDFGLPAPSTDYTVFLGLRRE
jgi:uncharacterized damage-inducible protein DinB